jgi:GAF domain-containing protein
MSDERKQQGPGRGEAVLAIFRRGAEFTKELLEENQILRRRLQDVERRQSEAAQDPDQWEKLRLELLDQIANLEAENRNIKERLAAVEAENHQFAGRYVEIEEENNNLANLYVASYQLHSTLDPSEVLKVIIEIVINLIGAEMFCIYVLDERTGKLEPVASEGAAPSDFHQLATGEGMVGASVASGEVATAPCEGRSPDPSSDPLVSIPLRVQERPVGAIAIHSLFQQKGGFSELDHELFTLLAGHAATAIFASRLHAQSARKLNTIQGFIDLLTK